MRRLKDATDAFGRRSPDEGINFRELILERKSYTRYFADYYVVPRQDGSGKTDKIYCGRLYQQDNPPEKRVWIRIIYAVLFIVSVLLFYGSSALAVSSNVELIIWLSLIPALIVDIFMVMTLYTYISAGDEFTDFEYKNGSRSLILFSRIGAAARCIAVVATAVFMIVRPESYSHTELIKIGMMLLSAAIFLLIAWKEKRIVYFELEQTEIPENAVKMVRE